MTGRIIYINNIGTASFSMLGGRVEPGQSRQAMWNGTAWTWVGEQVLTANQRHIVKTVNESYTATTTTLQNDDELFFPIAANDTWVGSIAINYTALPARDIKFAITAPS